MLLLLSAIVSLAVTRYPLWGGLTLYKCYNLKPTIEFPSCFLFDLDLRTVSFLSPWSCASMEHESQFDHWSSCCVPAKLKDAGSKRSLAGKQISFLFSLILFLLLCLCHGGGGKACAIYYCINVLYEGIPHTESWMLPRRWSLQEKWLPTYQLHWNCITWDLKVLLLFTIRFCEFELAVSCDFKEYPLSLERT